MTTPQLIDVSTAHDRDQSYTYTRIVDLGGRRVRARIKRDSYSFQSWAIVEVLTDALTWTHLSQENTEIWHPHTARPGSSADASAELVAVADRLITRAAAILP